MEKEKFHEVKVKLVVDEKGKHIEGWFDVITLKEPTKYGCKSIEPSNVLRQERVYYDYPSSCSYLALGKYLEQAYGDRLKGKLLVDAGCGRGGGVLYLREMLGVDARGIEYWDVRKCLEEKIYENPHDRDILELCKQGLIVRDPYEFLARHFGEDSVDAISFVYWNGNDIYYDRTIDPDTIRKARDKVPRVLKNGGLVFQVGIDTSFIVHPFKTELLASFNHSFGGPTYIERHNRELPKGWLDLGGCK